MHHSIDRSSSKPIAIWLLVGVAMIMIQVLLGGITRLTESGLSITEWKPLTGALPPLNTADWQTEFDKYKNTDQFRYIHADFTLSDFKHIFFWEWLHRLWARLLGVVFLVGFLYFLVRKKFKQEMKPMKQRHMLLIKDIKQGFEDNEVEVYYVPDYDKGVMELYSTDGEKLQERKLTVSEKQQEMAFTQ